jgi:NAD(P)H-flavin reductase
VVVLYGGRSPDELLYGDELRRWRDAPDAEVEVTVDAGARGWTGRVGLVTTLIPRATFGPARAVAMVCGPELMMRHTAAALHDRGVPHEHIRVSLERSMKCAVGHCGHCQLAGMFVCKDGPVFRWDEVEPLLRVREL